MKLKSALFVLLSLFLTLSKDAVAIYDPLTKANNKFGMHVFNESEIEKAASLVNSSGGEWGYITVVIESRDRDRQKWNEFMKECKEKKLIPIIRLATYVKDGSWQRPTKWDNVDFANFLNDLDWPVKNRYVLVYNEPNHGNEWGGAVDPGDYGRIAIETIEVFKERNENFYMMMAGLDAAAPNSGTVHMNWKNFLYQMNRENPQVLRKIDGWNSHSYPNPAFSSSAYATHDHSIISYRYETDYVRNLTGRDLAVFITETGWSSEWLSDYKVVSYWRTAIEEIWTERDIVAITPFVMFAGAGPFEPFSFYRKDMSPKPFAVYYINYVKTKGEPIMAEKKVEITSFDQVLGESDNQAKKRMKKFDIKAIEKLWEFMKLK